MTDTARPAPYPPDTRAKGWRFELNMEQVKKSDTWLRARTGRVRASLLLLWAEAWEQTPCGSLPDDDELLGLLLDVEPGEFAAMRPVLMRGWWLADDGRLYHDTITARVLDMMKSRAANAKRVAGHRVKQRDAHVSNALPAQQQHPESPGSYSTGTGTSTEEQNQDPPAARVPPADAGQPKPRASKRCPASFAPNDDLARWAAAEAPRADIARELAKFRDHTFKTAHSDWPAAFRNWLRRASDDAAKRPVSFQAQREAEAAKWMTPQASRTDFDYIDMEATNAAPLALR